jgi:hypothetical protein
MLQKLVVENIKWKKNIKALIYYVCFGKKNILNSCKTAVGMQNI